MLNQYAVSKLSTSAPFPLAFPSQVSNRNFKGGVKIKKKVGTSRNQVLLLATLTENKNFHVLIADDDEDDKGLFEEAILELNSKINLDMAKDGNELMTLLKKMGDELPDVIFLDLNMPSMDGKTCLKEIRKNSSLKDIPVVIYTTTNSLKDINETHALGANLFVRKPTSYKEILLITKKILMLNWEDYQPNRPIKTYVLKTKS